MATSETELSCAGMPACTHSPLEIVKLKNPTLHKEAKSLTTDEILGPEIQDLIESMKITLQKIGGVGLAAPQVGKSVQIAIIEFDDHSYLTPKQIEDREVYKVPFHVIINPKIFLEEETLEFFEGCLSVPNQRGVVKRAKKVRVECLNEKAEPIVIHATGWYARILQHEIDHLHGIVFVDKANPSSYITEEEYLNTWVMKNSEEIQSSFPSPL